MAIEYNIGQGAYAEVMTTIDVRPMQQADPQMVPVINDEILESLNYDLESGHREKTQAAIELLIDDMLAVREFVSDNRNYSLEAQEVSRRNRRIDEMIAANPEAYMTMEARARAKLQGRQRAIAADFDGTHTTFRGRSTFDPETYLMDMPGSWYAEQFLDARRYVHRQETSDGTLKRENRLISPLVTETEISPSDLIVPETIQQDMLPEQVYTIIDELTKSTIPHFGRDRIAEMMVRIWGPQIQAHPEYFYRAGQNAELREGVAEFYKWIKEEDIPMAIVSANITQVVEGAMQKVPEAKGTPIIGMSPESIASTDKAIVLEDLAKLRPNCAYIFIGDGSSDLPTLEASDFIAVYFALEGSSFARQLEAEGKVFFTYKDFNDIREKLIELQGESNHDWLN